MKVDIEVEMITVEGIHQCGKALRDVAIAQLFTHYGRVLGFSLGVSVDLRSQPAKN